MSVNKLCPHPDQLVGWFLPVTAPNCALNPAKDCAEEGAVLAVGLEGVTLYPNQACASSYGPRKPFFQPED